MRWSRLKRGIEALLAPRLRERVAFFATRYRHSHDSEGRGWITLDGVELVDMSTLRAWAEQHRVTARALGAGERAAWDHWGEVRRDATYWAHWHGKAENQRQSRGFFTLGDFTRSLEEFLRLSIGVAVKSSNPLIRAIAMLDRRLGKRRYLAFQLTAEEHPLVRLLHRVRGEAESWLVDAEPMPN